MDFLQESIQELVDADEEQTRDLFLPELPDGSTLEEDIEADPEKWRKFWTSLTGDAEHKRTVCMRKMAGKVDDVGAFCNALYTKFEQTEKKSDKPVKESITVASPKKVGPNRYVVPVFFESSKEADLVKEIVHMDPGMKITDFEMPTMDIEVRASDEADAIMQVKGAIEAAGGPLADSLKKRVGKVVKEKTIFAPIDITILEQGDKEDEYFELAQETSIRSGVHLSRAVTKAVKEALSKVEKSFDSVDVVLRRKPIEEDKPAEDKKDEKKEDPKEKAECELLAVCRLHEEGKVKEDFLKQKAEAAVKAGSLWDRIKGLILHEPTQKIVEAAFEAVKPVWPSKELNNIVGKNCIIDTIFSDRWVGKLQRDGEGRFKISMPSGEKKFSMHDVKRILVRS